MALTKEQRDALPDDAFAIPGKRLLPLVDEHHVRMGWSQLGNTKGLTDEERIAGRGRIALQAHAMKLDTSSWELQTVSFVLDAMSLDVPAIEGHPNRMPFSGVLTRIGEPSDKPPGGSNGKRTVIPAAVAEAALPTLLGMAVDYTPDFDGHDKKAKIGVITDATVSGNAIEIAGFLYASDFPDECARIQAEKNRLGFSYECLASISDTDADPWVIESCVFTGAAVLYKHLAAYTTTSLAAQADEGIDMSKEILEALAALKTNMETLAKEVTEIKASAATTQKAVEAAGAVSAMVKPHAEALRSCSAAMSAAGIGTHAERGQVKVLNHMADHMEAEAMMGRLPHVYRDHDYIAAAATKEEKPAVDAETAKKMETLTASMEAANTLIKDLQAKAFGTAEQPQRKTLEPAITALLAKHDLTAAATEGKLTAEMVDKTLAATPGLSTVQRTEAKLKLMAAGVLSATGKAEV